MNPKSISKTASRRLAAAFIFGITTVGLSAQDTLLSNNFEDGSMGPWQAANGTDAGLYENGNVVSNMGSGDASIQYAPNGNFSLWEGRLGSFLELTNPLPLGSRGYTSVTISFNWVCRNSSSSRRLNTEYSPDNGVTWLNLGFVAGPTATISSGSGTYTLNAPAVTFTDQAKFRFTFTDSGGAAGPFFVDNIVITASPEFSGGFWDTNGDTAGAGGATPSGTWGIDSFWSNSPAGDEATGAWAPGEAAIFSAGSDATGAYTVTVDGTQSIGGLAFKNGTPLLTGGTLSMSSNSYAFVADGLTATVASNLADDGNARLLARTGLGTLVLSGDNSAATGGMALNSGITRFETAGAINGTARNLTIHSSGIMAFGASFGSAAIQTALNERVVASSAGAIVVDNHASANFNFAAADLTAAYLAALTDTTYTGLLTPNGNTYRLGGAGGKLTVTDTSGMSQASPTFQVLGSVEISGNITGFTGTLTKQNSGTLTLSGANSYSANTTASGGTLVLAGSNSTATQTTINAATVQLASNSNGGLASGQISLSSNTANIQAVNADREISNNVLLNASPTLSGSQSLTINGTTTLNNNRTLTNNIVADKALTLAGQVNLSDNNTARTFIVTGSGATNISGNIVNGGTGDGQLHKSGLGILTLSGTNTYSGQTQFPGVVANTTAENNQIVFQGLQALSPNTTLRSSHTGGVGGIGTFRLLDDTAGTISKGNNLEINVSNNPGGPMNLFVGNNNTANGGSSTGTNTGSIIALGNLTFIKASNTNVGATLSVTGANAYQLQINNVLIPSIASSTVNYSAIFNPTTAPLTIAGDVTQSAGNNTAFSATLQLGGTASGNRVTGNISNATDALTTGKPLNVTKSGSSVWTLSGTNSYTGTTDISAGTLIVNGNSSAATGAVEVNGSSTLGGSGSIGGSVTVAASANLTPGSSVGTLGIGGNLTISAMAGGDGKLFFELGPIASSDKIAVTGTLSIGSEVLGFGDFEFTALTGLQNGTYKLITSGVAVSGTLDPVPANLTGAVGTGTGTLQISGTDIELVVSGIGDGGGTAYGTWASTNAPNSGPNEDYDGDGVSNAVEFVLGGSAATNDLGKLPVLATSGGNMTFSFVRDQASIEATTAVSIEVGTDLASWPASYSVPDGAAENVPGVTVVKNSPSGFDTVTLTVPQSPDAKKFARLKVVISE
jgi:fibronectin-binding autotransporter adhesin